MKVIITDGGIVEMGYGLHPKCMSKLAITAFHILSAKQSTVTIWKVVQVQTNYAQYTLQNPCETKTEM